MSISTSKKYIILAKGGQGGYAPYTGFPCLNVRGNDDVSSNRNVCIWKNEAAISQQWKPLLVSSGKYRLLTQATPANKFALDYGRVSGNVGNCDMWDYSLSGSDADTAVAFETVSASNDIYKIRIYSKIDGVYKYLTAEEGYSNDDNVSWKSETGGSDQQWKFVEQATPSGSKTLSMPSNGNQFYTGNSPDMSQGCSAYACMNCIAFYLKRKYTVAEFVASGAWSPGVVWSKVPYINLTDASVTLSEASICADLRNQINSDHPVIIHFGGSRGHYVAVYKYVNGGQSYDDFYVLDSAGRNSSVNEGQEITISRSKTYNGVGNIDGIKHTTKK